MRDSIGILSGITVFAALVAAWFTHIYLCLTAGLWGFLIAGAIFFPVAVVHGAGHWFGAW
jgi:hypothetical protein